MFQLVKQRMKGVKNISQITKAMELVAATKMRRSQEIALRARPYAYAALDLLRTLAALERNDFTPPLLARRSPPTGGTRTAIVLVTSDKGLAGSFNNAMLKRFEQFAKRERITPENPRAIFVAIGKKSLAFLERKKYFVLRSFIRTGDFTTPDEVLPIAELLEREYSSGAIDRAVVFSAHFRTALRQEPLERTILPIDAAALTQSINEIVPETGRFAELRDKQKAMSDRGRGTNKNPLIEPSPEAVLGAIASHLLHMELYHLLMEANASEHAARRIAMKNASENAAELAQTLTITYNKLRQAAITKEIMEITAGAEALKG